MPRAAKWDEIKIVYGWLPLKKQNKTNVESIPPFSRDKPVLHMVGNIFAPAE